MVSRTQNQKPTGATAGDSVDWNTLDGKWFHTLCPGGKVSQQGQIIGSLGHGFYVVRTFEWFGGAETRRNVVHVSDMRKGRWALYESDDSMREHYEHSIGVQSHERGTCECSEGKR